LGLALTLNSARKGVSPSFPGSNGLMNLPHSSSFDEKFRSSQRRPAASGFPPRSSLQTSPDIILRHGTRFIKRISTRPVHDCPRSNRLHPISPHASIGNPRFAPPLFLFLVDSSFCTATRQPRKACATCSFQPRSPANNRTIDPVSIGKFFS